MSKLLDALIKQRRQEAMDYQQYLQQIVELTKKVKNPEAGGAYPSSMDTRGKRALYDNLGKDEIVLATAPHGFIHDNCQRFGGVIRSK